MPQLTILEGSTFCISDELGDVRETTHGLFADDTRFLSRLCLTIDGKRPLLLSSGTVEYFSAAFFLRNPLTDTLPLDSISVRRERFVGDGMQDHFVLQNETMSPLELTRRDRVRRRLRGHPLGEGVGLLARRPDAREAAAGARRGGARRRPATSTCSPTATASAARR